MNWALHEGDNRLWLPTLADKSVDVVLSDPPYSEHVHSKIRQGSRPLKMGNGKETFARETSLGFDSLQPDHLRFCAEQFARIAKRWVLVFSDVEMASDWRTALVGAGLDYVRTGAWIKEGCTPQFTGDRPASGFEAITIAHPKGRKRWNGGGTRAVWTHPVVQKRGSKVSDRVHTTQKPLPLMLELMELFTEPGELACDPFAGSGTTLIAALRLGRRALGCELDATYAQTSRERLAAEERGQSLGAARAGQLSLIGGGE